jgi:hypothetical protein
MTYQHHVFLSYARADNAPRGADGKGWVQLFADDLAAAHLQLTQRRLEVFLDTERIENGAHWATVIQKELRASRLFIAVLSPNYLASDICRLELADYLRLEHSLAPGGSGLQPVYYVTVPELDARDEPKAHDATASLIKALRAANRSAQLDWRDWATEGLPALLQMDAAERLRDLASQPAGPLARFKSSLTELSARIGDRPDECALAELARERERGSNVRGRPC